MGGPIVALVTASIGIAIFVAFWRSLRMPGEIQRQQIKILGLLFGWFAIAAGLIVLLVQFSNRLSGGQFGILLLTLIFGGIVGLVLLIRRVTIPRLPKLPANAKVPRVNRARILKPLRVSAIVSVCTLGLGLLLQGERRIVALIVAGTLILTFGAVVAAAYSKARDKDRSLAGLELNAYLRWQLTDHLWQQWIDYEVSRSTVATPTLRVALKKAGLGFVILPLFCLFASLLLGSGVKRGLALAVASGVVLLVVVWLIRRSQQVAPAGLRTRLAAEPRQASFGGDGYACGGEFTPWLRTDCFLIQAGINAANLRHLWFRFRKIVSTGRSYTTIEVVQTVPIPQGAEADVDLLRQQLSTRCPDAAINLG